MQGHPNRAKTARRPDIDGLALGAALALMLAAAPAVAAEGKPSDGRSCSQIENDEERLACYDRVFRNKDERFGSRKVIEPVDEPEELRARVKEATRRSDGKLVVTLDNGQIWLQKETDSRLRLDPGDEIVIRRGFLGSYRMGEADGKIFTAVTRLN